jgi:hypothetical protein
MFKNKAEIATLATFLSLLSFVLFDVIGQNITSPEQFSKLVDFQDQILSSLTAQIKGWKTDCTRDDGVIRIEGNKVKIYDKDGIASLTVRWEPVSGPSWAGRKYFFFRSPFPQNVEFDLPQQYTSWGVLILYANTCWGLDSRFWIDKNKNIFQILPTGRVPYQPPSQQ